MLDKLNDLADKIQKASDKLKKLVDEEKSRNNKIFVCFLLYMFSTVHTNIS